MRDIKFRGKRLDNAEWVYGYYFKDELKGNKNLIYDINLSKFLGLIEVIPETVGQYTGVNDKNGLEIYEGDIVEWAGFKMEIFWGEDIGFGYGFCWRSTEGEYGYHESITGFIDEYKIIGNIHSNPELLENK